MGSSEQYNGNYTRYIAQRQERFESRMRAYEIQQKEIERQQAIIARYRMFNREKSIRAAESREKALEHRFPYIESAKIVKHIPSTIEIEITPAETAFSVACDAG